MCAVTSSGQLLNSAAVVQKSFEQYVYKWVWLCFKNLLLTKTGDGASTAHSPWFAGPCFRGIREYSGLQKTKISSFSKLLREKFSLSKAKAYSKIIENIWIANIKVHVPKNLSWKKASNGFEFSLFYPFLLTLPRR